MTAFLADLILIVHFLFVAFVVGGLGATWLGAWLGWGWVRNFWFRVTHMCAIVFVAAEAIAGIWCPLTIWEAELRGARADKGFIAQWIHRLLFYDFPPWIFTAAYVLFALVVIATWWFVRPVRSRGK
jgi:hypothetical protein